MQTAIAEQKCADLVQAAADSRLSAIAAMLNPSAGDLELEPTKSGGLAVTICEGYEVATLTASEYAELAEALEQDAAFHDGPATFPRNPALMSDDDRESMAALIWDDHADQARDSAGEAFNEYGLAFDYVAPGTFPDQNEGYWRYQLSCGGPSEDIRFFASPAHNGYSLYRAEFWYLDWFDGAPVDVTESETARLVWDEFNETETVAHVLAKALES